MNHKRIAVAASVLAALFGIVAPFGRSAHAEAPAAKVVAQKGLKVTFLSLNEAKAAIIDDSADPYFDKLATLEMSVKTGSPITGNTIEERRKECKARYQAACVEFTAEEKTAINRLLNTIQPGIAKELPGFAEQPWSFLKVQGTLEAGFPHTRGNHIVLSTTMLRTLAQLARAGDRGLLATGDTFIHEQTHVIERAHPERFVKLFVNVIGFERAKKIESTSWITERQVVNPDGIDCNWVFPIKSDANEGATRWIWPQLIFGDLSATSLRQMQLEAFELEKTGEGTFKVKRKAGSDEPIRMPLQTIEEYMKAVRVRNNFYHPNEIAADLIPQVVNGKAPADVKAWAVEAFGVDKKNR